MSLSGAMTAILEFVGDQLVNECGRPVPSRVLRYFGSNGIPQDWGCGDAGVLSIGFDRGWPSSSFPRETSMSDVPCKGQPAYLLAVRYDVCWKPPAKVEGGLQLFDDHWDAATAMLADVGDCIARALIRLSCGEVTGTLADAVKAQVHNNGIAYKDLTPSSFPGSQARLTWRLYAGPRSTP